MANNNRISGGSRAAFLRAVIENKLQEQDARSIPTAAEVKRREAERAKPARQARLTPGNSTEQQVHSECDRKNEQRLAAVKKRLKKSKNKARDDFGRNR